MFDSFSICPNWKNRAFSNSVFLDDFHLSTLQVTGLAISSYSGSSATLHCKPTMGEVSWSMNDSPLSTTSPSFVIESIGPDNEGVYKCQASFLGETIHSSAKISVSSENQLNPISICEQNVFLVQPAN
jgi:hypothetical protein